MTFPLSIHLYVTVALARDKNYHQMFFPSFCWILFFFKKGAPCVTIT